MVKETRFILIPVKKNAANCFEKDFFILMSNRVSDKTIESLTERVNVRLVTEAKDYQKWVST